jgi:hypothetical protein
MKPINEFLISKEMTATDLLNLCTEEEDAFWDEYADWREGNAAEKLEESSPAEISPESLAKAVKMLAAKNPLAPSERLFETISDGLIRLGYSSEAIWGAIKAARASRIITAEVYS